MKIANSHCLVSTYYFYRYTEKSEHDIFEYDLLLLLLLL